MKKKINLCEQHQCTGCMSCKQVCKQNAINVITIKGFSYPKINEDKCISCGMCLKVCPVLNIGDKKGNTHKDEYQCIAAWNKDDDVRKRSSSGGAFTAMAERILAEKGVVYGAAWDSNMLLEHRGIENLTELDSLRRSKYVQSNTQNTFNEVRQYLKNGRKVLYCGTPCQIAGLTAFLGYKEYSNLIKVDVVCQGVPSPEAFIQYIKEVEKTENVKVLDANFRSKDKGWRCGLLLLLLYVQKGEKKYWIKRAFKNNSFYNAFIKEYFMRDSCYECKFKHNKLGYFSDITIADFWRIGNAIEFKIDKYEYGVSAVIINNAHGKDFFNSCSEMLNTELRTWNEFSNNGGLRQGHKKNNNDEALEFLGEHTWEETQDLFFPCTYRDKLRTALFLFIGEKRLRKILKFIGKIK